MFNSDYDARVRLAVLCDYALTSEDGKVSAIGIFSTISFGSLPANYPRFFVVVIVSLPPGSHTARINMIGPTGAEVIPSGPEMGLEVPEGANESNLIIGFDNLGFETAGIHQLNLSLDDAPALTIPFTVMSAGEPAPFSMRGNA